MWRDRLPGTLLAIAVMLLAVPLSQRLGGAVLKLQGIDPASAKSPVSAVTVAILLGLTVRNLLPIPSLFNAGIRFATAQLLRVGIVCIGIKLSLLDVARLGVWGVPCVVVAIATGFLFVTQLNNALGLPRRLGTLIAAGTGICGVTAIVSTAPAIDADETEVAYAVANITLFGLCGMLIYPYLAPLIFSTSEQVGLFFGTAIHDTAQVVGSALTYRELHQDETAFQAATVTKLTRNLFLAVVVPLAAFVYRRKDGGHGGRRVSIIRFFPMFVGGFVLMALIRTVGDASLSDGRVFGVMDVETWRAWTTRIGDEWGARYFLGTAMASVGLGTRFSVFKGVGLKPFAVGLAGALVVGVVGALMALTLGRFIHL
jgi:uncharacterized integral membrane protein (TIGR00698 family)